MSGTALDREEIITVLRDLVAELRAAGEIAGIRLVGGAALALRYFDRGTTQDLDALHVHPGSDEAVAAAAERVARRHGWNPHWLTFEVNNADAIPILGRAVEWETIYDTDGIVIQVASKEAMLAMKLRANRPGRDTRDIRLLLALCNIDTLEQKCCTRSSTPAICLPIAQSGWSPPSSPANGRRCRPRRGRSRSERKPARLDPRTFIQHFPIDRCGSCESFASAEVEHRMACRRCLDSEWMLTALLPAGFMIQPARFTHDRTGAACRPGVL
jgi:hypothetical protein